jgi:hypothetical protein
MIKTWVRRARAGARVSESQVEDSSRLEGGTVCMDAPEWLASGID